MSHLGWVQFDKARRTGEAGPGPSDWGGDERPARGSAFTARRARRSRRTVMRPGRSLMLIALVAVTIVSRFM